jgi:hypothetical protein
MTMKEYIKEVNIFKKLLNHNKMKTLKEEYILATTTIQEILID